MKESIFYSLSIPFTTIFFPSSLSLEKERINFTESYSYQEEQFIVHISNLLLKAHAFSITHTIPHQHCLLND